ncbi:MAG: hypothetical protein ABIK81_02235 [candidate division WOR-3 bacterium]
MLSFFLLFFGLYIPIESWVNEGIEEMRLRGEIARRFPNTMPYDRDKIIGQMLKESLNFTATEKILAKRIFASLEKGFYGKISLLSDTICRSIQSLGIRKSFSNFIFAFEGIGKVGVSQEYPALSWDSIYGIDYRRGYGLLKGKSFTFLIGREPIRWGQSLLISGTAPPFNFFFATGEYKGVKGSFFFTGLDPYTLDTSRFLSAHRLEVALFGDRLFLGLSEAVLFCRQEIFQGSAYLNPFSLYRLSEYNYHYGNKKLNIPPFNDDLYWDFDFTYYLAKKCIYGEILLDDLSFIDGFPPGFIKDLTNSGPFGFCLGMKAVDFLLGRSYSLLQYTRINSATYFHFEKKNYYLYMGYPIGHPKGPDFDEIRYKLLYHCHPKFDAQISLIYERHGRTILAFNGEVPPRNCFLWVKEGESPEKVFSLLLGGTFFSLPLLTARGEFGWEWVFNYRLQEGEKKNFPLLRIELGLSF